MAESDSPKANPPHPIRIIIRNGSTSFFMAKRRNFASGPSFFIPLQLTHHHYN